MIKGRFTKGKSGNPTGRPKSELPSLIRKGTKDGQIIFDVVFKILTKSTSAALRLRAAEFMRDTGFGRPTQTLEHAGADGGPIVVEKISFK